MTAGAPGALIGRGRRADVYDLGDGRVLRRYREGPRQVAGGRHGLDRLQPAHQHLLRRHLLDVGGRLAQNPQQERLLDAAEGE